MKYRVDVTIEGYLEINASSKEEAQAIVEDGYSLSNFCVESDEVGEVSLISVERS
uniref:DpnD/PcfM-like protein n=1 Tax=viral metagenome TaxID=1070528 RepID=A0A6M3J4B7_9ZZZZ